MHATRTDSACHLVPGPVLRCPHGQALACTARHLVSDEAIGTPLCPNCYDYVGAVLQNASTSELWRRTTIYVQRRLATLLGRTQAESARLVRLASCRVAEFQRRGLVHLHAVIRVDSAHGTMPPIDAWQLAQACTEAAHAVSVTHPWGTARWGDQIDVQVLEQGDDRARRVAGYVAKYAAKSSAEHPGLEHRITSEQDLDRRELPPHLHGMAATAWNLGGDARLESLRLRRHAHRLGYGGHFLSKSRTYSTTFGALREARAALASESAARWRCFFGPRQRRHLACDRQWLGQQGRTTLRRLSTAAAGRGAT